MGMDKETQALIFIAYGYLTAAKARKDLGASELCEIFERHLTNFGFLDENKVLITPKVKTNGVESAQQ